MFWKISIYRRPTRPGDPPLCDRRALVSTQVVYGSLEGALSYMGMAPLTVTEKAIHGINAQAGDQDFSRLDREAGTVVFFERTKGW
jgi:hypothetical protein